MPCLLHLSSASVATPDAETRSRAFDPFPAVVSPQLVTLVSAPPTRDGSAYDIKLDGPGPMRSRQESPVHAQRNHWSDNRHASRSWRHAKECLGRLSNACGSEINRIDFEGRRWNSRKELIPWIAFGFWIALSVGFALGVFVTALQIARESRRNREQH